MQVVEQVNADAPAISDIVYIQRIGEKIAAQYNVTPLIRSVDKIIYEGGLRIELISGGIHICWRKKLITTFCYSEIDLETIARLCLGFLSIDRGPEVSAVIEAACHHVDSYRPFLSSKRSRTSD